jgi:hypothetical protein
MLTWLLACSGGEPTTSTGDTGRSTVELAQVGTACLFGEDPPADPTTFAVGAPVTAVVVLEDCASGCAADVQASCTVRQVDSEVVIDAVGSYTVPNGDPTCPAVCVEVAATCAGDPLADGYSWTLDYGGGHSEQSVSVPSTIAPPCATPAATATLR